MKRNKEISTKERVLKQLDFLKLAAIIFNGFLIFALILFIGVTIDSVMSGEDINYAESINYGLDMIIGVIFLSSLAIIMSEAVKTKSIFTEKGIKASKVLSICTEIFLTISIILSFLGIGLINEVLTVGLCFIIMLIKSIYISGYELQKEVDEIL